MKLKKLLAGFLSVTLVAATIPAGAAFSAVSAETTDVAVTYDLTTSEGQVDWTAYTATDYGGTYANAATVGTNGVTLPTAGLYGYAVSNPLADNVTTDGYTVTVVASIPATQSITNYEGFFGFNNHTSYDYFVVNNNGTLAANCYTGMNNWGATNTWWFGVDKNDTAASDGEMHTYTLTVKTDGIYLYKDSELLNSDTDTSTNDIAVALGAANALSYFNLGFNCGTGTLDSGSWNWFNSTMTVSSVSFYNTAMTPDEVTAYEIAQSLNLTTVGMQKGTYNGENSTRFIATVDSATVDTYKDTVLTHVGWAYEAGYGGTLETTPYTTLDLDTVTSASTVVGDDTTVYGFTALVQGGADYKVVPYVEITINGTSYKFTVTGATGGYSESNVYDVTAVDLNS